MGADRHPDHPGDPGAGDDLYRLVVETAEDHAIFVLDTERRILTWNRGAERLLGYTAAEIVGRSGDVLFSPEDIRAGVPARELETALRDGKADDNRWHIKKDGSRFWASGVMTRLGGPEGVRGLAKILRDQTALKLAREGRDDAELALLASEQRFRRLIESNLIGAGISNAEGLWVDANDAILTLLGYTRADLRAGKVRWDAMTPAEYRELDRQRIAEADARGVCTPYEKEFVRPDGSRVQILIGYATVTGFERYYVCFVLDLTPQKRVEQALREADRRKDEFLAMLAHELRNPLSAVGNAVQVLQRSASEEALGWAKEVIHKHVRFLTRLIDDLLDISRITHGKIDLERRVLQVSPVLANAVETVRPLIAERQHQLVIVDDHPSPIWVDADPYRLEQVVVNLLSNAAKYTEPGGRITLTARPDGGWVTIVVEDNGIGIPPGRIPGMFELFAQGDRSAARTEGGLGIGLTLVRNLIELHGGAVAADSEGPGRGSTFAVHLPRITDPRPALATASSAGPGTAPRAGLRVLVVDDNVDTARGLVRLLKIQGLDVATAFDGPAAIEVARRHRPEVVLLDIGLPGMDGYEVAARLRAEDCCRDAVITAISGYGEDAARRRASEAGFDHHLVKPVDYEQLLAILPRPR